MLGSRAPASSAARCTAITAATAASIRRVSPFAPWPAGRRGLPRGGPLCRCGGPAASRPSGVSCWLMTASSCARLVDSVRWAFACSCRFLAFCSAMAMASAPAMKRRGGCSWVRVLARGTDFVAAVRLSDRPRRHGPPQRAVGPARAGQGRPSGGLKRDRFKITGQERRHRVRNRAPHVRGP